MERKVDTKRQIESELGTNQLKKRIQELENECQILKEEYIRCRESSRKLLDLTKRILKYTEKEFNTKIEISRDFYQYHELQQQAHTLAFSNLESLEKYTSAPKVKQKKADEFWAPWAIEYDKYLSKNKGVRWAAIQVQAEIKKSGAWLLRTNGQSDCPNLSTIFRQFSKKQK